jgi:hypothetical protein
MHYYTVFLAYLILVMNVDFEVTGTGVELAGSLIRSRLSYDSYAILPVNSQPEEENHCFFKSRVGHYVRNCL